MPGTTGTASSRTLRTTCVSSASFFIHTETDDAPAPSDTGRASTSVASRVRAMLDEKPSARMGPSGSDEKVGHEPKQDFGLAAQ